MNHVAIYSFSLQPSKHRCGYFRVGVMCEEKGSSRWICIEIGNICLQTIHLSPSMYRKFDNHNYGMLLVGRFIQKMCQLEASFA